MPLSPRENRTLQLTRVPGRTLALALPVLVVLVLVLEAVARLLSIDALLAAPYLGSRHDSLEVRVHLLEEMHAEEPFDCILVGSSVVYAGLNPAVIEAAYQSQTGEAIRCFNFGVSGVLASGVRYLVDYVIEQYHPRLIVYGLSARDFGDIEIDRLDGDELAGLDWLQYRLGSFNPVGWLEYQTRHARTFGSWLFEPHSDRASDRQWLEDTIAPGRGFEPLARAGNASSVRGGERLLDEYFTDYAMAPAELDGLEHILRRHQPPQTQVVLVELPLHPSVIGAYFDPADYAAFNDRIVASAAAAGVLYWPTTSRAMIPDAGWYNLYHLNPTGAEQFSRWLGEQLGAAVLAGRLNRTAITGTRTTD